MIQIDHVSYTYKNENSMKRNVGKGSVENIKLHVNKGECVVLCGKSGCGKTTVLRMINGLVPHFYEGKLHGNIVIAGMDVKENTLQQISKYVGSVFQNPRSQFFHMDTTGEIAFNLENQGVSQKEMQDRVQNTIQALNLQNLIDRNIFELSGGEKQRIACGTVYAAFPEIIVLDEPSSNLDMDSIRCLKEVILRLKRAGKTIVVSEHRLWYLWEIADRYIYMQDGRIKGEFMQQEIGRLSTVKRQEMGLRALYEQELKEIDFTRDRCEKKQEIGIEIKKMICIRNRKRVLNIEKLAIPKGSIVAVIGENGAGKSSFCLSLAGLIKSNSKIRIEGRDIRKKQLVHNSYLVMQEAGHQLFCDSVQEELMLEQNKPSSGQIDAILEALNLSELREQHPGALSGGEKQRVAMATALCAKRKIMLYDEPTSGQDGENLYRTIDTIKKLNEHAVVSFVVTHDPEFILRCATHILHIHEGEVKECKPMDEDGASYMWKILKERNKTMKQNKDGIGRLLEFTGKYRGLLGVSQILSGISAIFILMPFICVYYAARELINTFVGNDLDTQRLIQWGIYALVCEFMGIAIYFCSLMCSHIVAFHTEKNLKMAALMHLSKMPLGYFDKNPSGKLRKIIDDNSAQTETYIGHQMPDLIGAQVTMVVAVILMLAFDWKIGIPLLVLMILGFLIQMMCMGKDTMSFMKTYQDALEDMNHEAVEYVRGISVVKVFGQSVHSIKKFKVAIETYKKYAFAFTMSCKKGMVAFNTIINASFVVLVPAALIVGATSNDLVGFIEKFLFYLIFSPATAVMLNKIMYMSNYKMQAQEAMRRIDEILQSEPQAVTSQPAEPENYDIAFENVTFSYDGIEAPAVSDVSFVAKAGTMTALVGHSGSGKSTVASLIPRFYDVHEGSIKIGGADVRDLTQETLMANVSFVFQNPRLFKESLADNIKAGKATVTREEILEAAHLAQCDDIIAKMPNGIDTVVGQKGVYLSGGEVQRIAIARAILKDAPILVLDEATAYADPENEQQIGMALKHLMKGKTIIMIAHRLSTIKEAEQILVMKQGKVIERGGHQELVEKQGEYHKLWTEYNQSIQWNIGKEVAEC